MGKHRANESILPLEPGDYERILPRRETNPRSTHDKPPAHPALERHYSVGEVGQLWGLSIRTVKKVFWHEPGILKWGSEETCYKRSYITIRIPESVLQRVHRRLLQAG